MLRTIKKSIKYLLIVIGIAILVPTFFYLIARIPEVQTFVVKRITQHISEQIKATVTVGSIDYSFFNRLNINKLLIMDQNSDTLAYSEKVSVNIRRLDFRNKIIRFGLLELDKPLVSLITDTTGVMNLKWYLNLLGSSDSTGKKSRSLVSVNQIEIRNGRFRLINLKSPVDDRPLDFNHLQLSGLNGEVLDARIQNDSTIFRVNDLEFTESGGFLVRSMTGRIVIAGNDLRFGDVFLYLDSSIINARQIDVRADSSASFSRFTDEVRLNIDLQKSLVNAADVRYFIPSLRGMTESVELSGHVSGTVAELKGRNIIASFGDKSSINCDFDLSGLPDFNDTYIHIGVNSLKTRAEDFEYMRMPGGKTIRVPELLYKLGNISFTGSFTGFLTDFVTYGRFTTDDGVLSTDISLRPEEKSGFRVKGLLRGTGIDLGDLTNKQDILGRLSMETNIDGVATSAIKISGNITGKVDSVGVNGYIYRNVNLSGVFTEKTWDGSIKVADDNIRMDLLGMFDFRNELPEFDFTLNLAESNLHKLNIDKADSTARLSMLLTANFRGTNIDNLFGEIKMLNSTLWKYGNKLDLYNFSIRAFNENNRPAISLKTDFLDADLRGYYNFGEIGNVFKSALASLMPSKYLAPPVKKNELKNNFTFSLNLKNTDRISNFFRTGLLVSDKTVINGVFNPDSTIRFNANAKMLNYRNNIFRDLALNARYSGNALTTDLKSASVSILGQSELKDFQLSVKTKPDNFMFSFGWDNREKIINKGNFAARGAFTKSGKGTVLRVDIDSSTIYSNNNPWKLRQASVIVDSGEVKIDRFFVSSGDRSYGIDGTISGNSRDTLKLAIKGFDLSPLTKAENKSQPEEAIPFNPRGIINGHILVSNVLKNPMIESNVRVTGFSILGADYGDISLVSTWNAARKVADISASNNLKGVKNIDIGGYYDPKSKNIRLNATAFHLPVDALNPLLKFFASQITGTTSGKVRLTGKPGELVLTGALMAENTSMKIDYLQTKYKINDSIRFDRTGFRFRNIRVTDEKGNTAILSGLVNNSYFKDYTADLIITMDKSPMLVLNTQEKDNELFYGTAYATGVATIKSTANLLSFDISAKTGKGTRFFIPLNSGLTVSQHSFISFVTPDTANKAVEKKLPPVNPKSSTTKMEINMDLDVTPDAEVQLLIDPKAGDVIRGRGSGKLNMSLNQKDEFRIYGDYTIDQGEYLFTLQNILNKKFDVESGGKVTFNGNVENAEIDLTADYKNLKTSLYPILPDEKYNVRVAVEPQLKLSGKLFNPVVGLNIYLPNADEEVRTLVRNAITSEEEMSRQFLYLLVMNSFYADPNTRAGLNTTQTGTSAAVVTTTEMLSNQVSNWLSQISNDFDVGFVYRPSTKDINSQELQVALSTQLLNDKVTINGNFDVRGANNPEGTPLTGDFDIEYKLTEKVRFKVFNRYNNVYSGKGVPYTQGVGIFFKQDFNRFSDLLKKKNKSEMKKEDEVSPQ